MSEGYIRLELDCLSGEKIIMRKSDNPGALVEITLGGQTVNVRPAALLLVLKTITAED